MKKLLAITLLCALMLSVMVSFSSCVILDKIFGTDEPDEGIGEGEGEGEGEVEVPGEGDTPIFRDEQIDSGEGIETPNVPLQPDPLS